MGMRIAESFASRCVLAICSGAIYALAYPPLGWRWLVIPGLAGLLVALNGLRGTRARTIGFIHGMTAYALGLSWLYQIFGGLVVALWCVLAAFTALFAEMQSRANQHGLAAWKLAVFTILNWCGWEFIRAELFPLKFPWMSAGLAIGPNLMLPWIGVYGVSMLVLLAAWLIASRKWREIFPVLLILLVVVKIQSAHPLPDEKDPLAVKVAGVQLEEESLNEYLATSKKLPSDVQYVVWPEYSVPYDLLDDRRDWPLVQSYCREHKITLTLGTQSKEKNSDVWRNIALTLDSSGVRGTHNKVHTVHFFNDGHAGTTALPVLTDFGKVGTPICFDNDYENIVRRMTAAGAEMFIVPMMDAKSWTARQHDQHAELFRIRAAENGRWMFVCGSSGVSQLIDPSGRVHGRLPALDQGVLIGTLRRETKLTFYTRFGWLTPWCILAAAAICWLALLVIRPRIKDQPI